MKTTDPRKTSFKIALFLALFSTLFITVSHFYSNLWNFIFIIFAFLVVFIISYFLYLFSLEKFINEKIRLIYKTIHNFKVPKEQVKKGKKLQKDSIKNVNEEVLTWVKDKKLEIDELKKLEIYRREFLGNVSHELKTPITNIQGYVLTLLDGGLEDSSINKEYLQRAEKNIYRMVEIVEDLEEISKLESGLLELKPEKVDIVKITKEVIDLIETKAEKYNIKIVFGELYEKPIYVYADIESIKKVITNLIDNSLKYGNHNNNGRTEISFFDMDEDILIEITDNGLGIEESNIPRLFERFYRTDKARSRAEGGSGLGLAIVKHIIEAHQQTINVRSTIGVGSTFAFTLKKYL